MHFGEHLTIDGYGGDFHKLWDRTIVYNALDQLPEKTGMNKITKPYVNVASDNGIKDPGGWSGYVMIAESHISVHTFPARGFVSIDFYTCKNGLDVGFISQYFKDVFDLKNLEVNFIQRGNRYPDRNIYDTRSGEDDIPFFEDDEEV